MFKNFYFVKAFRFTTSKILSSKYVKKNTYLFALQIQNLKTLLVSIALV